MNVCVGKIGKKFYFAKKKWTIDSGDSEVTTSLIVLAKKHPEITFYVIGPNDLDQFNEDQRKEFFPNENVVNCWDAYSKNQFPDRVNYIADWFKSRNIKVDFGWMHAGPVGVVNIPERSYTLKSMETDKKEFAKCITMAHMYAAPTMHFLNDSNIPYVAVGEDPRYYPLRARDLFNRPKCYLNTFNDEIEVKYVKEYYALECHTLVEKLRDAKYDRWFLASEQLPDRSKAAKKDIFLDIYTNGGGSTGAKKLRIAKEYLSDQTGITIYGNWGQEHQDEAPEFAFKNIAMADIEPELYRTKYTFMFHFKPGYPSSKFWKMIWYGIIPFYHVNMDTQQNQPVHEFCRVKTSAELKERIQQLEENPKLADEIRNYHYDLFTERLMNGDLIDEIFCQLGKIYTGNEMNTNKDGSYLRMSVLNRKDRVKKEEPVNVIDIFANL